MHDHLGHGVVVWEQRQELSPEFRTGLQHPRLVFDPIRGLQDLLVCRGVQVVQSVHADELDSPFDEFVRQDRPDPSLADDAELRVFLHNAAETGRAGPKEKPPKFSRREKLLVVFSAWQEAKLTTYSWFQVVGIDSVVRSDRALTIKAHAFSLGAVEKIKAAGGSVEVIED